MKYFDANLLVHYFADFDLDKHLEAKQLVEGAVEGGEFYITLLCVQETSYAMAKLQQPLEAINYAVQEMLTYNPTGYERSGFERACSLAQKLGYKNVSDCLHTAMAEAHGCEELITYNRKDFVRIQPLTDLKIIIL